MLVIYRAVRVCNIAERRRRWSDTYKGVADSDDEADGKHNGKLNGNGDVDPKLRREEHELAKIETGIAQVLTTARVRVGRTVHRTPEGPPSASPR